MSFPGITDTQRQQAQNNIIALNDSPIQRRARAQRLWFLGAVSFETGGETHAMLRDRFKQMVDTGFNAVRFHPTIPETGPEQFDFTNLDRWFDAAADADIRVICAANMRKPSDQLLSAHGLSREQFDTGWYQTQAEQAVIRARLEPIIARYRNHPAAFGWAIGGEPNPGDDSLDTPEEQQRFANWLKNNYPDLDTLQQTWTLYPDLNTRIPESFDQAWRIPTRGMGPEQLSGVHRTKANYAATRDLKRFKADKAVCRIQTVNAIVHELDPDHWTTMGTHQLFFNQPFLNWDTGELARSADLHHTSIHLAWHFEPVNGELDRPHYMQSKLTVDYNKHALASAYETTGGAVQYSGGLPNAMTPQLMRRMMLNYLAAGNTAIAFWVWNHRPGGWEQGEYGLTSLSGAVTTWAKEAGHVGKAMQQYIDELWEADHQPHVGILESWDTDALLCMEPPTYEQNSGIGSHGHGTHMQAMRARIGAARTLINHQIPFDYLTNTELHAGIAEAYPVIYATHMRAIDDKTLARLKTYVENGGHLIADVQFAFCTPWGKLHPKGPDCAMAALFGGWVDMIHHTRTWPMQLNQCQIEGFFADITVTNAQVTQTFNDGRPAVIQRTLGRGMTTLIGFDPGRMAHQPGRADIEQYIATLTGFDHPWQSDSPMAYRRRHANADHYFLINDGPRRTAQIICHDCLYAQVTDLLDNQPIRHYNKTIICQLPARSGKWLRCQRL